MEQTNQQTRDINQAKTQKNKVVIDNNNKTTLHAANELDIMQVAGSDIVKKLRLNEILNAFVQNANRCITPYATLSPFALFTAYANSQLTTLINSVLDRQKLFIEAHTHISANLVNHALQTMPEIEREVKDRSHLQQRMQNMTESLCSFLSSKYAYYANLAASVISVSVLALSATTCPWILATLVPTYFLGKKIAKKDEVVYKQSRRDYQETRQRFGQAIYASLSDPQSNYNSDVRTQKLKSFEKASDDLKTSIGGLSKKINKNNILTALGYYAIVGVSMCLGLYFGANLAALAGIMIGTGMFTSAVTGCFKNKTTQKKHFEDTMRLYREFCHNPVYNLTYGNEKCLPNTDTICLNKIMYAHRDTVMYNDDMSDNENLGKTSGHQIIHSDKVFMITKGITVLSGPSGVGKSTLYKLLRHGDDVTGGEISYGVMENGVFKGKPLSSLKEGVLSDIISFGNQSVDKDGMSNVVEFIHKGNPHYTKEDVLTACRLLNLNVQDANGQIKPFSCLSGGETKKAVFLRAAIAPTPIVVFDEPTSGVDADNLRDILNYVNILGKHKTVIYTTHIPEDLRQLNISQIIEMTPSYSETGETQSCVLQSMPCETKEDIDNYIKYVKSRREKTKTIAPQVSPLDAEEFITKMICLDVARQSIQQHLVEKKIHQPETIKKCVKEITKTEAVRAKKNEDKGFISRLFQQKATITSDK